MTVDQWQKNLRKKAKECTAKAYNIGVVDATGQSATRIFERGQGFNGKIGFYNSTDPVYIALKESPKRFSVRTGAKGRTFKSYKDYRQAIGRETGFVNLRLSNELYNDYSNPKVAASENATSLPQAFPIKVSNKEYIIALNKSKNVEKKGKMEAKYGRIFGITRKEQTKMSQVIEFELAKCYD